MYGTKLLCKLSEIYVMRIAFLIMIKSLSARLFGRYCICSGSYLKVKKIISYHNFVLSSLRAYKYDIDGQCIDGKYLEATSRFICANLFFPVDLDVICLAVGRAIIRFTVQYKYTY